MGLGQGERIRVACCDDDAAVRRLVAAWISEAADLAHVGDSANGLEAVELVERVKPDVLVLDLDMPVYDGIYAIDRIRSFDTELPIVVHSGSSGSELAQAALGAGGSVFVPKDASADSLLDAIRRVAA